jgi:hypothetical protein
VFSLIRLTPPRHAVRRRRRGVIHHPATKVVATPLVTATTVVAMDATEVASSPATHVAPSPATPASQRLGAPTPAPVTTSAPATTSVAVPGTTVVAPPTTTTPTGAIAHLQPVTTSPRPRPPRPMRSATIRAAAPRPATAAPPVRASVPTSASAPHTARTMPLGVFAGSGEPAAIAAFASVTGTHPTLASDYLLQNGGWDAMDGAGGSENWMLDQWRNTGYRLVLGVPIIPAGTGATLAEGAAGSYDRYFTALAQTLVANGAADAILRLGWEFDGTWYPWSVTNDSDAANFAAYWRHIVGAMRAVPGAQFSFSWNPNGGGSTNWDLELAYPGSAYVDYIGTDVYDEYWGSPSTPQASWNNALNQQWGLNWLVSFATREGRPIAIPEWSVTYRSDGRGLGDDPYFIDQFASWIAANDDVAFTCIFTYDDSSGGQNNDITDGQFANALAAFRSTFG